jgi:hypothetical protein
VTEQKTVYYGKNPKKVVLAELNGLQVYVYPYDFPEKVFIALGGNNIQISKYEVNKLLFIFNRSKWYLNGGLKMALSGKSRSRLGDFLKTAYNQGLKDVRRLKK